MSDRYIPMTEPVSVDEAMASLRGKVRKGNKRIADLEAQLTAANALILECDPYLKERETPVLCIERNRKDAVQALEMCADEMIKKEKAERELTAANARVEELNANAIVRRMGDIDYENGDSLCLKFGGDGDNGEYLIELMEQAIEALQKKEKGDE